MNHANVHYRAFNLQLRNLTNEGVIDGYASVFGVKDSYGTAFAPGAFKRTLASWAETGRPIPMLWQHSINEPIGVTTEAEEDEFGLRIQAKLIMEVGRAREALALAKAGALGGLSIGFSVPQKASDGMPAVTYDDERGVEVIREAKLFEYSMVTFPSNQEATIDAVRTHEMPNAARELHATTEKLAAAIDTLSNGYRDAHTLVLELRNLMASAARPARATEIDAPSVDLIREAKRLLQKGA
jgi:uncharacterized protein